MAGGKPGTDHVVPSTAPTPAPVAQLPRIPFSNSVHLGSGLVIGTHAADSGWTSDGVVTVYAVR